MNEFLPHDIAKILLKCADLETSNAIVPHSLFGLDFREDYIKNAVHFLNHFLTDQDLREKDAVYDASMRKKLQEYAAIILDNHPDSGDQ